MFTLTECLTETVSVANKKAMHEIQKTSCRVVVNLSHGVALHVVAMLSELSQCEGSPVMRAQVGLKKVRDSGTETVN